MPKSGIARCENCMRKEADCKCMSEGGDVGGAETSTTGNKTKTGGSNPGGASTGGAGTVTITTGKIPPKGINISNVGGNTSARNAGGMDPGDEDDTMKMSNGGIARCESCMRREADCKCDGGAMGYDEGGEVSRYRSATESEIGPGSRRETMEARGQVSRDSKKYLAEGGDVEISMSVPKYKKGGRIMYDEGGPVAPAPKTDDYQVGTSGSIGNTFTKWAQGLAKGHSKGGKISKYSGGGFVDPNSVYENNEGVNAEERLMGLKGKAKSTSDRDFFAEGGEIPEEGPEGAVQDEAGDDDLLTQAAHECMEAFHNKDKQGFLESLRALVLSLKDENDVPSMEKDTNDTIG